MRLPLTVALLLAGLALALPAAGRTRHDASGGQGAPLPGWWRYDTSFLFSSDSDERCLQAADIDKVLQGPSNRHYDCTYPVREVGGGHARFEGVCVNHKHGDRAQVSLSGTYGPERFDLHGVVRPQLGGLSLPLNASISARRLGATCPTS